MRYTFVRYVGICAKTIRGAHPQVVADLFPQQRCQCPWCARRRDIALLHSQQQHMAILARPSPALGLPPHSSGSSPLAANPHAHPQSQSHSHSHQLSGHLPARPVLSARSVTHGSRRSCSASRVRPGSAAAACGSSASVIGAAGQAAVEGGEAGAEAEADVSGRLAGSGSRKEAEKRCARGRPPR